MKRNEESTGYMTTTYHDGRQKTISKGKMKKGQAVKTTAKRESEIKCCGSRVAATESGHS